jgi:nitrogen fixation NifU-like protein
MSDMYREILLEEAAHPRHLGVLTGPHVKTASFANSSCGDMVTVYAVFDEMGTLQELKWQGQGCVISQASMSVLAEYLNSTRPSTAALHSLQPETILELLGLETIVMGREKCLQLGLKTVRKLASSEV